MSKVFIYEVKSYLDSKEGIMKIISSFDELKNIKKNTKVVIKANLVSALAPEKSATTNNLLLKELTSYLLEKKCEVVIGDSPGGVYNKVYLSHIYKTTKMTDTGAKLNKSFDIRKVGFKKAKVLKSFEYTKYLDDADLLINFCKLKTHAMMKMSATVKNLFGVIPGTLKPEYHYRFPNHIDFANMLIDLNEYFKMQINIVDAITAMEGNGPTMGIPREVGLLLASKNPYELDYVCSKIINLNPMDVPTISESIKRGLVNKDSIETNVAIDNYIVKDFKNIDSLDSIKFLESSNNVLKQVIGKIGKKVLDTKPAVSKNKCIGCGKCTNTCPAKAIEVHFGKAKINRNKCIKCYCCQEFCPIGAIQVKKSMIRNAMSKKEKC